MCSGPFDQSDDVVDPHCRICDCMPCMCGAQKYQSDKEYQEEVERDRAYWDNYWNTQEE